MLNTRSRTILAVEHARIRVPLSKPGTRRSAYEPLERKHLRRGIASAIGNTPLIKIQSVTKELSPGVALMGKAEYLNPGGSVKDRAALNMIARGIQTGTLRRGMTLIDASSGNTGIAYAMLCASLDIPLELVVPGNISDERKTLLRAFGARLILSNAVDGMDGARQTARDRFEAQPGRYFYPDQYNNRANWQAHYNGTGQEIIQQTNGAVTHFVAGLGTTGTFVGVSRRLRQAMSSVECISFQPDSPMHAIEGMKHLPTSSVPGIYDASLANQEMECSTDEAVDMATRLAREEGLFVGISAGASVATALKVARQLDEGVVVTILCDAGGRYMNHPMWTSKKQISTTL